MDNDFKQEHPHGQDSFQDNGCKAKISRDKAMVGKQPSDRYKFKSSTSLVGFLMTQCHSDITRTSH